ncbi:hypothetical protein OEZ86_002205 [Tetradesmus obliquus]|nr:hypothetical protein OEZ86_002205 [Tetradesmus obliquus]
MESGPAQHVQGALLLQGLAAALKRLSDFAGGTCASVGPVYHLIHSCSLAQHLTNCCLDLCNALRGLVAALAGLGASQELQEDLGQLLSQLERGLYCTYNESQHQLLLELQVQAEAVRSGQADASTLSAIVTQQVLQHCSVAQLAADVAYLQQAAQEQQQLGNHVALASYQQLAGICKVGGALRCENP